MPILRTSIQMCTECCMMTALTNLIWKLAGVAFVILQGVYVRKYVGILICGFTVVVLKV